MPIHHCTCGAKYRLPDEAVGKRARCKKCGQAFVVGNDEASMTAPLAPENQDLFAEIAAAAAKVKPIPKPRPQPAPAEPTVRAVEFAVRTPLPAGRAVGGFGGFINGIVHSMQFLFRPGDIIIFVFLWIILAFAYVVLPFAGCLGQIGMLIILGWYSTFRFDVVLDSAGGKEDLPSLSWTDGAFEDVVAPFYRWIASWGLVLIPAFLYLGITWMRSPPDPQMFAGASIAGLSSLMQQFGELKVFAALLFAGFAMWPIVILCIAMGGFSTLLRPDLILLTVLKSLPGYLVCVLVMAGFHLTMETLNEQLGGSVMNKVNRGQGFTLSRLLAGGAIWIALSQGLRLFFDIVSLRAIGLYYRNFKHQFAWEWE